MFEDSLVASKSTPISVTRQWTTLGSIAVQSAVAALITILPLLHPERLPIHVEPPHLFMPLPPKPVVHVRPAAASASPTSSAAPATTAPRGRILSFSHNNSSPATDDPVPSLVAFRMGMGEREGLPDALTAAGNSTSVSAVPVPLSARQRISGGVATGMLLTPIRPVYPAIARAARVEGTVVLEATISSTGTIESLHVVSGPEMLRQAAIDAIQAVRYRPYRLNGQPVDVQTTITLNFRLGS